jgi:hypothetical protein
MNSNVKVTISMLTFHLRVSHLNYYANISTIQNPAA